MKDARDPILFGHNTEENLVAADLVENSGGKDEIVLFYRAGDSIRQATAPFEPFILVNRRAIASSGSEEANPWGVPEEQLDGKGELDTLLVFSKWQDCLRAKKWLSRYFGYGPRAPYHFVNDPVTQHLLSTGRTMFKGMVFDRVRRMQVDIECVVSEGYEFCNAARSGDAVVAIGLSDSTGWTEVLYGKPKDEKKLLTDFVKTVRQRDPDVIEGHNIFNFDLSYLRARAKRHRVALALGRNGSEPRFRSSRLSVAERTIAYTRCGILGRHVVDTLFLSQAYDVSERSLEGLGLKQVAAHFGLTARGRTYVAGSEITKTFRENPEKVVAYVRDDAVETGAISAVLSQSYFVQAQMLPYSYQDVCVRGNASKIDALMVREYMRRKTSVALPGMPRSFAGGYTDLFFEGVAQNVHHCDVRSLYPSLMLTQKIGPASDELGVFHTMLDQLRTYRFDAKRRIARARTVEEKKQMDALQGTFKVLINSFYGYLGFAQGKFCDFDAAEKVTAEGRSLLNFMIEELKRLGAKPIEIDTDGVYFVPPAGGTKKGAEARKQKFRRDFAKTLPEGIEIEFDGEYKSMYSYKMKNYALLSHDGEMVIRGGALKSRGLEPYLRAFLREMIRLKLTGEDDMIPALHEKYRSAIAGREWPVTELAKTATLQDTPSTYATKVSQKSRGRDAAYELALKSAREYRPGDQITYYVTGKKKSVAAHTFAKPASEWDPADRDENVAYYTAKLDALYAKFYDRSGG